MGSIHLCDVGIRVSQSLELKFHRADHGERRPNIDDLSDVERARKVPLIQHIGKIHGSEQIGSSKDIRPAVVHGGIHTDKSRQVELPTVVGILALEDPISLALRIHTQARTEPFERPFLQKVGRPETTLIQRGIGNSAAYQEGIIPGHPCVDVGIVGDNVPTGQNSSRHVELDAFTALFTRRHGKREAVDWVGRQHIFFLMWNAATFARNRFSKNWNFTPPS